MFPLCLKLDGQVCCMVEASVPYDLLMLEYKTMVILNISPVVVYIPNVYSFLFLLSALYGSQYLIIFKSVRKIVSTLLRQS
jgi:hypothetical protein